MNLFASFAETCKQAVEPFLENTMIKSILATFGISAGFLFGVQFYNLIFMLLVLVVIDSITGAWAAREAGTFRSRGFVAAVPKTLRYLFFIASGHLLQGVIGVQLYIENGIIIYLAATEFISVAENLGKAGMPVPQRLLNKIEELRDKQ